MFNSNNTSVKVESQPVLYPVDRKRAQRAGNHVVSSLTEMLPRVEAADEKRWNEWEKNNPFPTEEWWEEQERLSIECEKWDRKIMHLRHEIDRCVWRHGPVAQLRELECNLPQRPDLKWVRLSESYFGPGRGMPRSYYSARMNWRQGGPAPQAGYLKGKLDIYKPELLFLDFVATDTVLVSQSKIEMYAEWESESVVERWKTWLKEQENT